MRKRGCANKSFGDAKFRSRASPKDHSSQTRGNLRRKKPAKTVGRPASQGYKACCRTCDNTLGKNHGPLRREKHGPDPAPMEWRRPAKKKQEPEDAEEPEDVEEEDADEPEDVEEEDAEEPEDDEEPEDAEYDSGCQAPKGFDSKSKGCWDFQRFGKCKRGEKCR